MNCLKYAQAFPTSYEQAITDMRAATKAAIADKRYLLEIEFPTSGLDSVAGDGEGQNEMTYSLEYLRQFLVLFQASTRAERTRVFFPDKKVSAYAKHEDSTTADWSYEL